MAEEDFANSVPETESNPNVSDEEPNFELDLEVYNHQERPAATEKENSENDSQEIQDFIEQQKSSNTVRKTASDMKTLKRFCTSINETKEPELMTAAELDKLLSKFFKDVKKENGGQYEPSTLTSFHRSFQRYFSDEKVTF